jgi:putative lipoic acid-binding regulatory protein
MVDANPPAGDPPPAAIEYPCLWAYKVIGRGEADVRAAIAEVVAGRDHTLDYSRTSAKGSFVSLLMQLEVQTEEQRNAVFVALKEHAAVVMVI